MHSASLSFSHHIDMIRLGAFLIKRMNGVVSKETVAQRQWGNETRVDNGQISTVKR